MLSWIKNLLSGVLPTLKTGEFDDYYLVLSSRTKQLKGLKVASHHLMKDQSTLNSRLDVSSSVELGFAHSVEDGHNKPIPWAENSMEFLLNGLVNWSAILSLVLR